MQLNYKQFGTGYPLIILHGLLGSLDNWQTIAKKLATQYTVYIIDQRNHGRSPHSADFNYQLLADDLLHFMEEHDIKQTHLIGHSMGGKVVMEFALQHPDRVGKLIVVDIAPVAYDDRHSDVFNALFAANAETAETREEVETVLRRELKNDESTVQFLMKNLYREMAQGGFRWKFNLPVLHQHYADISGAVSGTPFYGPTLFIKGERSSYIGPDNFDEATALFPNNQLTEIKGAGHWVHADKPNEFTTEVQAFLN